MMEEVPAIQELVEPEPQGIGVGNRSWYSSTWY